MLFTTKAMLEWLGSRNQDQNCIEASGLLESAVSVVTTSNIKTVDIGGKSKTEEVTRAIASEIKRQKSGVDKDDVGMMKEDLLMKW